VDSDRDALTYSIDVHWLIRYTKDYAVLLAAVCPNLCQVSTLQLLSRMDDERLKSRGSQSRLTAHSSENMIQPQPFQYQALKHPRGIRLLRVAWDPTTNRILGEFSNVCLDGPPLEYEAISYCWGDPTPRERVWLSKNQYLVITESAADVLHHLIAKKKSGYIWIDALCINQSNDEENAEKGQQIRLMQTIFASAKCVIAWIGKGSEDSERALEFIGILLNKIKGIEEKEHGCGELSFVRMHHELPQNSDPGWEAFRNLLNRPWFSRLWIVQEMVMASRRVFACGNAVACWDDLMRVIRFFRRTNLDLYFLHSQRAGEPLKTSIGLLNLLKIGDYCRDIQPGSLLPLHELLMSLRKFEATDPRDKIFAVLGLADNVQDAIFSPEYTCTPQHIFTKICRFLMVRDADLYLLHCAGIGAPRVLADLPSWVPDFFSTERYASLGLLSNIMGWRASGAESQVSIREHPSIRDAIILSGSLLDSVSVIAQLFPRSPFPATWEEYRQQACKKMAWLDEWEDLVDNLSPYPTAEVCSDVCWRTLICNKTHTGHVATSQYSNYQHCSSFWKLGASSASWMEFHRQLTDQIIEGAHKFEITSSGISRRLFTTTNGYAGKGATTDIASGDKICIFHGAKTPFIIRPNSTLDGQELTYALVGDCYVHGLMYGDGLKLGITEDIILV
jgi:hypothetical protein